MSLVRSVMVSLPYLVPTSEYPHDLIWIIILADDEPGKI